MTALEKYLAHLIRAQLDNTMEPGNIPEGVSFDELVKLARENHMEYMVFGSMLKTELTENQKNELRGYVMRSVMRTGTQIMEYNKLIKRFEEDHVVSQPMKGARLKYIYPTVQMREMSDIDILIQSDSMDKARGVLEEEGYILKQSIKHHDIYMKAPFMVLEAHKVMYDKTVDKTQFEYFSDFSRAHLCDGYQYTYDFSREDFYVYMISHMAKHFYQMGCGVRNLVDIYVYQKKYGKTMDVTYLKKELENLGLATFANHMETLSSIWLTDSSSDEFYDNLFEYMLYSGIYGKDENGIWCRFAHMDDVSEEKCKGKLRNFYYFPPFYYMVEYYPWLEKFPFLLPWAWIVRAVCGIFEHKGTQKRKMIKTIDKQEIDKMQNIYKKMQLNFQK